MQELEYESMWCIIHPTYEYNYKVITRSDTIYKNITSPIGANTRIQRDI